MSILRDPFVFLCLVFSAASTLAQSGPSTQANRVAVHPDLRATTRLQGHIPSWAVNANDQGAAPSDTPLRLTFVLSRSPELQASFDKLLADQQDPDSPRYHQWLTPQQVGEQYGPTQQDIESLTSWLDSQGFSGAEISPSRIFVTTTASASKAATALSTSFRYFNNDGKPHLSATVDPALPTAFASIVNSIAGLADIELRPMHHAEAVAAPSGQPGFNPKYTISSNGSHYVTPGDFSVIFDLKPVYSAGYTGTGQKVAIIGRSRVAASDITAFETNTGLATNVPNTIIPTAGLDPGLTGDGDQAEATLDVDRVIGTAPGVQADLVVSSSLGVHDGIFTAAAYEVQTLLDPVMTISFGSCEQYAGPSQVGLWDSLFSQAASEGISVFVSAGDSGAAGCNPQFASPPSYQVLNINYICASSYATCVGGTEFNEGANPLAYWSTTNSAGLVSALGYIPEGAWNESFVNGYVSAGGGGGASIYVAKPSWQTGAGVPADNARDVPDVSFPSAGHDGYFACFAIGGGDCANGRFESFSGTSAAAPAMAAVTALLNQKAGSSQGNMNPLLYRVAATSPNAFHDATPASSGVANCSINTPSLCNNSTPSAMSLIGGLAGYALTTGYDQATGLGSLDVANFLNAASIPIAKLAPTVLTVAANATGITNTGTATFTATLTSTTAGSPSGTIQFYANGKALGSPIAVVSGMAITPAVPFPAAGSYYISATYSGDSTYASTIAAGIQLTVNGLLSVTKVTVSNPAIPTGTSGTFSVSVAPSSGSGTPTGVVRFYVNSASSSGYAATVPLSGGVATASIPFLTLGNYTMTAYYLGDSAFSPSISAVLPFTVQRLTSQTQLSSTSTNIGVGGGKIYSASVSSSIVSTAPHPTGTVQLYSNGTALGAPLNTTGQIVSPIEIFSAAGTYNITAVYSGDAYWQPSTANGLTLTVLPTPASYQVSVDTPSLVLPAGGSSTHSVLLLSNLGFAGTVNLACSIAYNGTAPLNSAPTCTLANTSVSLQPDSGYVGTSFTISTTAPHTAMDERQSGGWWRTSGVTFCALLLFIAPFRRRSWKVLSAWLVLAVAFTAISGCGNSKTSSSGTGSTGSTTAGTTPGSYTVTLTASSTVAGIAAPAPATIALTID